MNATQKLHGLGQSLWLDNITRNLLPAGHLNDFGARPQRLLWASTGAKNPTASDILYIEALAAPFTVNAMLERRWKLLPTREKAAPFSREMNGPAKISSCSSERLAMISIL